ncbi:hypothetical protein RBH26_06715 [Natronolimnohabitans sp. A-GB9]|uniref:hypothetical protein n=1 Tax=Natronolimnohabitans sp. A-GB9 TaxID=3069757 RepID=UPI0027B573CC|nr:hypothetical protein [Natronolimnohabitans sp. A-GB9]MDQ2050174.1 hypothetical protein [Natronolimnohabitans sp. A-GB9]
MSGLSRRQLLAGGATALAGTVAGCSSSDEENDDENAAENGEENDEENGEEVETEGTTEISTILGEITVANSTDTAHAVDVLVEFDSEIEEWETRELAAYEDVTLERSWPTDSGQVRVTARLDQNEPVQVTPAQWNDPDCLNLLVRIDNDGDGDSEVELHSNTDGGPCGESGAA